MNFDKKQLRKIMFFLIPTIVLLFLWLFKINPVNVKGLRNKILCEQEQEIRDIKIDGYLISKYIDSRGIRYFKYVQNADTLISHHAMLSEGFYNLLQIGDTIQKFKGSLEVEIRRPNEDTTYLIDLECEEF